MATKKRKKKKKAQRVWTCWDCPDPQTGEPPRKFYNEKNWERHLASEKHKEHARLAKLRRTDPEVKAVSREEGGLTFLLIAGAILGAAIYFSKKGL